MNQARGKIWLALVSLSLGMGCSSTPKKSDLVSLADLHGKKVALVSVEGEDSARKIAEVALINQLVKHGTFELVSKGAVEKARTDIDQDPSDWMGLAKRSGADLALRVRVEDFRAEVKEGYSKEEVYDSQLAEENGTDGKTERVFKAKALEGDVKFALKFTDLGTKITTHGTAEASDRVEANARTSAVRLPPRLRFLENLSNTAFKKFFDQN